MKDSIESLLGSEFLDESARNQIQSVWNLKLDEAKEQITKDLRAEFAHRYDHDRKRMVDAVDQMVQETLKTEIAKIAEEQERITATRVRTVKEMKSKTKALDKFVSTQLAKEIREFRRDNTSRDRAVARLDEFVNRQLRKEVTEFAEDKRDLAETKVKLIRESKTKFNKLRTQFVERTSQALAETVQNQLSKELRQLKEDITQARENNFGRKIFEAFVGEFSGSYLNENQEVRKLQKQISNMTATITEAKKAVAQKNRLLEETRKQVNQVKDIAERSEKLGKLLKPLNREKADVMRDLLESVPTSNLEKAFTKYLPAVTNTNSNKRRLINETISRRESTGDRKTQVVENSNSDDYAELKLLAGLK